MIVKNINAVSAAKIFGLINGSVGLVVGIVFALMTIGGYTIDTETGPVHVSGGLGILAVVLLPLTYSIIGFVGGLIFAFLFNLVAGFTGGLKLEVE